MSHVVIATTEADATAASVIEQHHAQMTGALTVLVESLIVAAATDTTNAAGAQRELLDWCEHELVPHALAEERTLYPLAHATDDGRLLVEGMFAEHGAILAVIAELRRATDPVRAAAAARALHALFDTHVAKENDLLVPLLVAASGVSLATALHGMHEALVATDGPPTAEQGCGGACTCGDDEDNGYPELDARAIPHALRHATIFGALDTLQSGAGLVLVAPHDPLPLIAQSQERSNNGFEITYLDRGPDAWRLAFVRL